MDHKTLLVLGCLVLATAHKGLARPSDGFELKEDAPFKRGFSTFYSNSYYDLIAMSVCASVPIKNIGHIFPVRRRCGKNRLNCNHICKSGGIRRQATWMGGSPIECIESLHIYKGRPQLAANPRGNTDVGKIGLVTYRYHSCLVTGCGPNYCCCRKGR